ncbi:MAG: hypothetical protein KDD45_05190, partial [Bdellovibrionales bacterium]|nr:hypothetical protein [Bdellovibrionales bacterium]
MKRLFLTPFFIFYFSFHFFTINSQAEEKISDPLLVKVIDFKNSITATENFNVNLELNLPEGYHAYEDQFKVQVLEPNGFQIGSLKLSPLKKWYDKFSKKER